MNTFTDKQVKDLIKAFCWRWGKNDMGDFKALEQGLHHRALEILFPESEKELNYGAELDGFESEYFPSPEETE